MNSLEIRLNALNPGFNSILQNTKHKVALLLQTYSKNFPTYTDHSIEHTQKVMDLASELLNEAELLLLNDDEIFILCMACVLHDVGMCIPESKIIEISETEEILSYRKLHPDLPIEVFIRDIHHILSYRFIMNEWQTLNIPSEKYAQAIGLVAQGHRKVDLNDFNIYEPQYFVKDGRSFVCMPYLASIIKIADELDITNLRTPEILCKYYMPDNEISQKEWIKHKSTIQINFFNDSVKIEANCTDHNILAALEEQFEKIQKIINGCQKTIRAISFTGKRNFNLEISKIIPKYNYIDFDPKGIKYSFDVKNVINAFVGKDLYDNNDAAIREALQNAIDACNYKKSILSEHYVPKIEIEVSEKQLSVCDNGQGMDDFIIENYFGKLASSFYDQQSIKNDFEAIGQFGIGVFSYFLISDYIDIETKRRDTKALKFRTDQDPNGYFHFFDNFSQEKEGTKLILHLKSEFFGKFNIKYLEKFVRKYFPYIDISIFLKDELSELEIFPDNFNLNFDDDILHKMYFSYQGHVDRLSLLTTHISNNDYEGTLGFVVPIDTHYNDVKLRDYFNADSFEAIGHSGTYNEIKVSQKGVFINNYAGRSYFTVGKLNIKNKLNINLNRTSFRNTTDISNIIDVFEAQLIDKLYKEYLPSVGIKDKQALSYFTNWYIMNNWGYDYTSNIPERTNSIKSNFHFAITNNDEIKYHSLLEIEELYDEIYFVNDFNDIGKEIKHKTYVQHSFSEKYIIYSFFDKILNYGHCIDTVNGVYIVVMRKEKNEELKIAKDVFYRELDIYPDFSIINNNKIVINILDQMPISENVIENLNRYDNIRVNATHPFIVNIIKNSKTVSKNNVQTKLVDEIIAIISDNLRRLPTKREKNDVMLDKVNLLIDKLNDDGMLKCNKLQMLDL